MSYRKYQVVQKRAKERLRELTVIDPDRSLPERTIHVAEADFDRTPLLGYIWADFTTRYSLTEPV